MHDIISLLILHTCIFFYKNRKPQNVACQVIMQPLILVSQSLPLFCPVDSIILFLTMYDLVRHRNWSNTDLCLAQNDLSLPSNSRNESPRQKKFSPQIFQLEFGTWFNLSFTGSSRGGPTYTNGGAADTP